jgi:D-alanine-D-alanine ligase
MRLVVLMGGANTERDVSISSGVQGADALRQAGHEVAEIDTAEPVEDELDALFTRDVTGEVPEIRLDPPEADEVRDLRAARSGRVFAEGALEACVAADLVLIMVFGDEGESGHVQAVLDWVNVRYTGPGPTACALSFDKELTKRLADQAGIPTAEWVVVSQGEAEELDGLDLPAPWVVKPVRGGSTIGTGLAEDHDQLREAVRTAHAHDRDAIIETFLPGTEVSVATLGEEALPVIEVRPENAMFDYEAKYQPGRAEEICPAPIPDEERDQVQRLALATNTTLKMPPYAFTRVDLRQGDDGGYRLLEVNGVPGMTATSLYPQCAAAAGLDLPELCDEVVRLTLDVLG